ncbi:hypothetical protein ACJ5H2_05970 [Nocardioides sp. R1-1]|uniref:hypothetical protein n=1 Tax=Nocardioides sp. R1-1 TaxID=3383502 RepID=UPI0038D0CD07
MMLAANLKVNRRPKRVRRALRRHLRPRPKVVALQEAGGYLDCIRDLADQLGYRVIAAPASAGKGMNSSVLLIHADVTVYASGVALARTPWIGPRLRIRWAGRAFSWAVVDLDGKRTLVASVHMPTEGRGLNRVAWAACKARLRLLVRKHGSQAFALLGDWNNRDDDTGRKSIRHMAKRLGAEIVRGGSHIDYAVARGIALVGRRGPARGSDHPSTTYSRKEARPGR